jgi:hypothetical protein
VTAPKTPRPVDVAQAWQDTVARLADGTILAASLAVTGPIRMLPGQIIRAAGYHVSRAVTDDGTVLLSAVDADGYNVEPPDADDDRDGYHPDPEASHFGFGAAEQAPAVGIEGDDDAQPATLPT